MTWALPGDGNWNTTDLNWELSDGTPSLFSNGATVTFGGAGVAPIVVTVDLTDVATSEISFTANNYTVDGGAFTINPDVSTLLISLDPGISATISAPISSVVSDVITLDGGTMSQLSLSGDSSGSLGELLVVGGQVNLTGDYGGALTSSGSDVDVRVDATVAGDLDVSSGTVTVGPTGAIEGATTVAGNGTLVANGGTFSGPTPADNGLISVVDGSVEVAADTDVDIANSGGEVTVNAGQTLTGIVTNSDGTLTNLGTVTGLVTNSDTIVASGNFVAGINNLDGLVQVAGATTANVTNEGGDLTVAVGQTLTGSATNTDGTVTNLGTITGLVTNTDTVVASGSFGGGIANNDGIVQVVGDSSADITNAGGDLTVDAGQTLFGDVNNQASTSTTTIFGEIVGNLTVSDGLIDNDGTVVGSTVISGGVFENAGTLDGTVLVDQNGAPTATLSDTGGVISGQVTNVDGTILADGTTFSGGVVQSGGSLTTTDVDLGVGATNAGGTISIIGAIAAQTDGDVINTGGDLIVGANQTLSGTVINADAASSSTLDGALLGELVVNDGLVTNTGTVTGSSTVNGGQLANTGTLDGSVTIDQTAAVAAAFDDAGGIVTGLVNNEDGAITAIGTTFQSGLTQNGGISTISDADLGLGVTNAGGVVAIEGVVAATTFGNVTNTGGDLSIGATQTLDGNLSNADSASSTTIDGALQGNLSVSDGAVVNNGTISGTVDVAGGQLTNSAAVVGDLTVTNGALVNNGTVDGNTVVSGGLLENSGLLDGTVLVDQTGLSAAALDDVGGTVSGLVTNEDGTITSDGTVFRGGVVQNDGILTVTDADLGTGITNAGGSVFIDGAFDAQTVGNVANTGGDLTITVGQTLSGNVTNSDPASTTLVEGTLTGDLSVSDGTATNTGTVDGDVTATGSAIIDNSGLIDGSVTLSRTTIVRPTLTDSNGTISGLVTNNDGSIVADGTTFSSGLQQNAGVTTLTAANLGTGLTNADGLVTIDGATPATTIGDIINSGGDLVVASGQTVVGDVDNTSALSRITNDGQITGAVTLSDGAIDQRGVIDGNLTATNADVFATNGTLTGTFSQSGGQTVAIGSTFAGGIDLSAIADLTLIGTSTGDVRNAGGNVTIASGASLTGDLTQTSGQFDNNGILVGALTISGGSTSNQLGSDVTGLTTLQDGGVLNGVGGTFSGGLRLEGGTLVQLGTIVGDVENAGDDLTFASEQVIQGNLLNSAGILSYAGTVFGALDVLGGTVTTLPTTVIQDTATVSAGVLQADGGTFDGGLVVDGGAVNITQDITAAGVNLVDGELDLAVGVSVQSDLNVTGGVATLDGDVVGDITQTGGVVSLSGTVEGNYDLDGGTANNSGVIGGGLQLDAGTFDHRDGSIDGLTTVNGGNLIAGGGDFGGLITNDGGIIDITGITVGELNNIDGTVTLEDGGSLSGDAINGGNLVGQGGSVAGSLVNDGFVDLIDGDLSVGDFLSRGTIEIGGTQTLTFGSGVLSADSILTSNGGTLAGDLVAETGSLLSIQGLAVRGDFDSFTSFSVDGPLEVQGDLTLGAGSLTFETGDATVEGVVTIADGALLDMRDATTLRAASIENTGAIFTTGDVVFDAAFGNAAILTGNGNLSFSTGLRNSGAINLVNGSTNDTVSISGGGLSGGGVLQFDVDLSNSEGAADSVTLSPGSFIAGNVNLEFNILGSGGQQATDILLIDVAAGDPGNFTIIAEEIVDPSGILTYSVTRNAAGDVVIEDGLNPGIAGLAGNIVLTQSLIGSVVNRPSSPFVTTLAFEDENPCGSGMWGRTIAGGAKSIGEVTQDGEDGRPFDGAISATFAGFQLGGDFACFNGAFNGWDLAFGVIGGINFGQTTQPVFAIDVNSPDNLSDLQTGTTDVDFTQAYTGVYASAVQGPWAFDLQYRFEGTEFEATNRGAGDLPGLGLDGTEFGSWATTLSGAASYVYNVPNSNLALVPTAGFAYTQVSTDEIVFDSRGTVQIDDFESKIGFVGGTLAQSSFGDDGVSAYRQFISATVYNDFAEGPRSTFSPIDNSGDRGLRTENLGLYTEVSFGVNFVRVLQEDEFGAVKQFSANARADMRISPRLKSWGVTAQARFQF